MSDHNVFVDVRRDKSRIPGAGNGLFAAQDIPKGWLISRQEGLLEQEDAVQEGIGLGHLLWRDTAIRLFAQHVLVAQKRDQYGDTAHINHAGKPNCFAFLGCIFSKHEILDGEELTIDYRNWLLQLQSDGQTPVEVLTMEGAITGRDWHDQIREGWETFGELMGWLPTEEDPQYPARHCGTFAQEQDTFSPPEDNPSKPSDHLTDAELGIDEPSAPDED